MSEALLKKYKKENKEAKEEISNRSMVQRKRLGDLCKICRVTHGNRRWRNKNVKR
jgi:hypothetical protein